MGTFFGRLYCVLFEDFISLELADYLWGITSKFSTNNQFVGIGLTMFGISLAVAVLYYYVFGSFSTKVAKWWGWWSFMVINAVINFFVGWQWVLQDYYNDLMVRVNPETNLDVPLNITESNIIAFGVTNALISVAVFFVWSMVIKWWSVNCHHRPF